MTYRQGRTEKLKRGEGAKDRRPPTLYAYACVPVEPSAGLQRQS